MHCLASFCLAPFLSIHSGGAPKSALVKIRLCPPCAYKMHYPKIKEAQRTARAALRAQRTRDRTERQSAKERRHQEKRTGKSRPQAIVLAPDASSSAGVAQSASGSGSRTGDSDSSSASASEGEDASDSSSSDDESTVVAALVGSKRKSVESESTRKSSRADQSAFARSHDFPSLSRNSISNVGRATFMNFYIPVVKILQRFERPSHSSSTGAEDPLASHAPASSASSSSSAPMRRPAADAAPSDSFSAGLRAAQRFNASQRASSASSSTAASAASSLTPQAGRADGASASEAEEWAKFEEKLMASLFV